MVELAEDGDNCRRVVAEIVWNMWLQHVEGVLGAGYLLLKLPAILGHGHQGNKAQGQSRGVRLPPESLCLGVRVVLHWVGCGVAGERSSRSNTGLGIGREDLRVKHWAGQRIYLSLCLAGQHPIESAGGPFSS